MLIDRLAVWLARRSCSLPRGNYFVPRTLARLFPKLREYPIETRYGRIYCDLRETVCQPLLQHGEYLWWGPDEEAFAKIPLTKDSVVLDVGANIGVTAKMFADRAGHVHAFEPAPRALRLLCVNTADLPNVTVHAVALSNEMGTTRFAEREALDVSSIGDDGIEVPMRTVDSFGLRPQLIKIDVEGFEDRVLQGAIETLKHSPVVVFEAFDEAARKKCENIIISANPNYRFETMGGGTNHLAWPTPAE